MAPHGYVLLVLAPALGMLGNVFTHIITSRLNRGRSQIKCMAWGFVLGLICVLIFVFAVSFRQKVNLDFLSYIVLDIVAYVSLAYGYFHFVNINIASLRVRILQEIIDSACGLSQEDILERYDARQILDIRIKRFVSSNQLIEKQGFYFTGENRSFLALFWFFEILKFVFLGRGNRLLNAAGQKPMSFGDFVHLLWQNQFIRFLFIGGINTIFGYSTYALLVIVGVDYRLALTIGTILAVLFNYYTNGRFVFLNKGKMVLLKFILLNIIMYIFNQALLIAFVNSGIGKLISQAVIIPIIIVTSFIINKTWVFCKKADAQES